jgi:thiosulfate/3-mercaptopyruvate sulfurtransferase
MRCSGSGSSSSCIVIITLACCLAGSGHYAALATVAPLVDAATAAAMVAGDDDVVLLDARRPQDVASIRVRGSRYADYGDWLRKNHRDRETDDFGALWQADLAYLGIGSETNVLIYGGRGSYNAPATVWYALQGIGVAAAAVVQGGFEALAGALPAADLDWSPQPFGPESPAPARGGAAVPIRAAVHGDPADKADALAAMTAAGTRLLDARSATEFAGQDDTRNPRPGRIPGALNVPHGAMRTEMGLVRSPLEIRDLLAEDGITPDTPLVVYCQGGGRSAFLALALVHAGFHDVRNYFGSFGEWSRDLACPVETGSYQ